jgi:TonB family protein
MEASAMIRLIVAASLVHASTLEAAPNPAPVPAAAETQTVTNWDIFLKLYPARAIAAREEGLVGFIVTLDNQGAVQRCQVTHTSGHPLLDEETCKLITMNALFKPDPALSPSQTKTHEGVINWKLPANVPAPAVASLPVPPKPIAAKAAPEQMVCKMNIRIGTLAGVERTCMTPSEWSKQSDAQKQFWDEQQGRKGYTRCDIGGAAC